MTVCELIETLQMFPPGMEVVVDDLVNETLLPPRLDILRPNIGPVSLENCWLLLCGPSHVGDLSVGDGITTTLMELNWRREDDAE